MRCLAGMCGKDGALADVKDDELSPQLPGVCGDEGSVNTA
jgi:hypothetical protein